MSARRLALLAALGLAACGGGTVETGPPADVRLDMASRAGNDALSLGMLALAVRQYKEALSRAYERDDAGAIADCAYNLALAQMRSGQSKAALATVREARAELDRRRATVPAELVLVQAAAAYRTGDLGGAQAAANEAIAGTAGDPDTLARAWFIRGLVAADRNDGAALAEAIAALSARKPSLSSKADLTGDLQELQGRAALLDNRAAEAFALFEQSAANRQQAIDYRGMARALALAGNAALQLSRPRDAADLFLRAGRSALLQGDPEAALPLLKRAEELARQTGQQDITEEVGRLRKSATVPASRA